jgi:hypothetical protein
MSSPLPAISYFNTNGGGETDGYLHRLTWRMAPLKPTDHPSLPSWDSVSPVQNRAISSSPSFESHHRMLFSRNDSLHILAEALTHHFFTSHGAMCLLYYLTGPSGDAFSRAAQRVRSNFPGIVETELRFCLSWSSIHLRPPIIT